MIYYIYLFLASICIAIQFSLGKVYQVKYADKNESLFFRSIMMFLFGTLIFLVITKFKPAFSLESLIFAIIITLINLSSTILQLVVVKYGEIAIYTVFMMLGGMIIPYIHGVIFLDETPTICCIIGLFVLIGAIVLSSIEKLKSKSQNKVIFIILCFIVFVLNGLMSVFSKLSRISSNVVPVNDFLFYKELLGLGLTAIIFFVLHMVNKKKNIQEKIIKPDNKKGLIYAIIVILITVVASNVGYFLQLIGAEHLPSTILYPIVSGGSIVLTSISGFIFFKENISTIKWISIILTVTGTILFLF